MGQDGLVGIEHAPQLAEHAVAVDGRRVIGELGLVIGQPISAQPRDGRQMRSGGKHTVTVSPRAKLALQGDGAAVQFDHVFREWKP